jgi:four helix bundle protein
MSRLKNEFLERIETFSHRVVDVAEAVERQRRSSRVVDQMIGAGSAVGANAWEAAEALSAKDFCKCLGIALKEISESRYWLRFVVKRTWIKPARVAGLHAEAEEIQRVLGSMVARTRTRSQ